MRPLEREFPCATAVAEGIEDWEHPGVRSSRLTFPEYMAACGHVLRRIRPPLRRGHIPWVGFRSAPEQLQNMEYEGGGIVVDGRLAFVCYNRIAPTLFPEFLEFWEKCARFPRVVGAAGNVTPSQAFKAWKMHLDPVRVRRWGLPKRFGRRETVFRWWKAQRALRRARHAVGATGPLLEPKGVMALGRVSYLTGLAWAGLVTEAYEFGLIPEPDLYATPVLEALKDLQNNPNWKVKTALQWGTHGDLWRAVYGRVPKAPEVLNLPEDLVLGLRPLWKVFQRGLQELRNRWYTPVLEAWAKLVITFGHKALGSGIGGHAAYVHGIDIRLGWPKPAVDWAFAKRKSGVKRWEQVVRVCNNWARVEKELGKSPAKVKFDTAVSVASSFKYTGVSHSLLAREAAKWDVPQKHFECIQRRWLNALASLTHETIPMVRVEGPDNLLGYRLVKEDPRGIFLGEHTNCCQHPAGDGSSCAWHGHEDPDGAFFVVEKFGQIVAQSWVWRNESTLCFDSIQVLGNWPPEGILAVYEEAANAFIGRLGITRVVAGENPGAYLPTKSVDTPIRCYTDAKRQYLLAGGES